MFLLNDVTHISTSSRSRFTKCYFAFVCLCLFLSRMELVTSLHMSSLLTCKFKKKKKKSVFIALLQCTSIPAMRLNPSWQRQNSEKHNRLTKKQLISLRLSSLFSKFLKYNHVKRTFRHVSFTLVTNRFTNWQPPTWKRLCLTQSLCFALLCN